MFEEEVKPVKVPKHVTLDDEIVEKIEEIRKERGLSFSAVTNMLLKKYFASDESW